MSNDLPFLEMEKKPTVPVTFDGQRLDLPAGENLAAALLAAGIQTFRHTAKSGAPRGPFCMMGACFDCLIEIDGVVRQACMLEVAPGLKIACPGAGGGNHDPE